MSADPGPDRRARMPRTIDRYRLLSVLGEGGMGTVYLAEQTEPIRRRVALKVVKLGMDSRSVIARFEQERQALAVMDHDGIARIFDCGTTEQRQPYFVMEYVQGLPLVEFCERRRLTVPQRVQLVRRICEAVEHAHQRGVVHRDLKPGNIIVADRDGHVRPKIIDFGVAKAVAQRLVDATVFTVFGSTIGTIEYMAPEQASSSAIAVDGRADVYSLGVILYELLVGELPFPSHELRRHGDLEALRILCEVEPPPPSARLDVPAESQAAIAAARRTDPASLRRMLEGGLDAIVLRALEKDPARRYASAREFAAVLQRQLLREAGGEAAPRGAEPAPFAGAQAVGGRRRTARLVAAAVLATAAVVGAIAYPLGVSASARRLGAFEDLARARRAQSTVRALQPGTPAKVAALDDWLATAQVLTARRDAYAAEAQELGAPADAATADRRATLDELAGELQRLEATTAGMRRERRWAEMVGEASRSHPHAGATWSYVRQTLATADGTTVSAAYRGQRIELADDDVLGLVPIGIDEATQLWEFYDLRSAWDGAREAKEIAVPTFADKGGAIEVRDGTGIVFVLVPGGVLTMRDSGAVSEVRLDPFLVARHELTRAQWRRLARDTGAEAPEEDGGTLPVARVDWFTAADVLLRSGLSLPTEAQWEYACRAGTTEQFSFPVRDIVDYAVLGANQADAVGRHRPNGFGLFDVHGNVMEWCLDGWLPYSVPAAPGDGLRSLAELPAPSRVARGGWYGLLDKKDAGSAARIGYGPEMKINGLGLRAVRRIGR